MADVPFSQPGVSARRDRPGLLTRLAMSPRFHALAERLPFVRGHARREGAALFSVVSGFVQSQALMALVETGVLRRLAEGSATTAALAHGAGVDPARLAVLLQAGAALKLVAARGDLWRLCPRGGAFLAVPGLESMVRHHDVLYRDLADPVAFLRGETQPELAGFWPYVFGAAHQADPALAARYSTLMAESQALVAADTLRLVDLSRRAHLVDVGGGTGAFLAAVAAAHPKLGLTLFDLPEVLAGAAARLGPLAARITLHPGSFRTDPLPDGADTISLVRVLYDHADATVDALLASAYRALPAGGMIVVSEPMSGGRNPDPATDVYFALYTMAMGTGRTRSADEISQRLAKAGFSQIQSHPGARSYVTSVVTARRE